MFLTTVRGCHLVTAARERARIVFEVRPLWCAAENSRIVAIRWAAGKRQGRVDRVDLSPVIDTLRFYAPLRKNPVLFESAHLIDDGYALAWGDGVIDRSAESVERLAEEAMTGADFCAFLDRNLLTHQAAAAALGRSKRQIEHYLQYEQIPRMVALACFGYEARREVASQAINRTWQSWEIDYHRIIRRGHIDWHIDYVRHHDPRRAYDLDLTFTYGNFLGAVAASKATDHKKRKTVKGTTTSPIRSRQKEKSASG
jgi:hypothetical protein